jgi:glycosyltransferase involved in cell wall biosynthesis
MMNNEGPFSIPGVIIPCQEISDQAVFSQTPLVSVKMITYNHEPYISQAIEGVLKQKTDFPIELIIGEDCSTDRTREIVLEYQKKYPNKIRVLISESNIGGNKNSKRVYAACRGKYVAYCEGDDYWHNPDKLQIQIGYMEAHTEVGLVHSDADMFNVKTGELAHNAHKALGRTHDDNDENLYLRILEDRYKIITCTVCVRRDLLCKIVESNPYEFTSGAFLMGDTQCWLEFARVSKLKFFPDSFAMRNLLWESASRSQDINKNIRFVLSCRDLAIHYLDKYGAPPETIQLALKNMNHVILQLAYKTGDPGLAVGTLSIMRKYGNDITLKGRVWYLTARYPLFRIAFSPLIFLLKPIRKVKRVIASKQTGKTDEAQKIFR